MDGVFARFMLGVSSGVDIDRRFIYRVCRDSLRPAGYCQKHPALKMDGTIDKRDNFAVRQLMGMPPIQQALEQKFNAAGFTLDFATTEMKKIAGGEMDDAAKAAVQLKAIDMRIKMTTGYAPTKVDATVQGPGRSFDAKAWEDVPPIATEPDEPRNVTVQTPTKAARRGGKKKR